MRAPLIAVTSSRRRALFTAAMNRFTLLRAGARSVRLYPGKRLDLSRVDGLLIGGGDDIGAMLYGGEVQPDVRLDPERDALELQALELFWGTGRPVLGICRGAQMINVFRGGTLHQNVRATYEIRRHPRTPLPLKRIRIVGETRLGHVLRLDQVRVNSLHNQAVDVLGDGLLVAARDRHGMVQAIEHEGAPFRVGVQWHPELLFYKLPHRRLFRAFAEAAREAAA